MLMSAPEIYSRLEQYCKTVRVESEIIVIGAASIILNVGSGRGTMDIDIITKTYSNAFVLYDIDIVNEGILFLCHDYRSRLVYHGRVGVVNIYALHPMDVALVKLGRGLDRDMNDIKTLVQNGVINLNDFVSMYKVFRSGYGGSYAIIDNNFYAVTGIRIQPDARLF
jgi:hypothetical protein